MGVYQVRVVRQGEAFVRDCGAAADLRQRRFHHFQRNRGGTEAIHLLEPRTHTTRPPLLRPHFMARFLEHQASTTGHQVHL